MALATYPAVASPIKSIQRGSAAGAGTVTITAVDINKSFVNIQGTVGTGTVSASFNMSMNAGAMTVPGVAGHATNFGEYWAPSSASVDAGQSGWTRVNAWAWNKSATVNSGNASVGAGSNNLVAGVIQGYLSNSTSLVVSGACRWEVVEYN